VRRRTLAVALVAAALVIVGLALWGRGPTRVVALTPEMQRDFGAAVYVPDDVSAFAAERNVAAFWKGVWHSRAVQSLVALPLVQQGWQQLQRHPGYRSFIRATKTEPVLVQALPILEDAVSTEIFACTGPDLPGFLQAVAQVVNAAQFAGIKAGLRGSDSDSDTVADLVDAVLANEKRLQLPSVLLGFKLSNPKAAEKFLDTWIPKIGPTPLGMFKATPLAGGTMHVLEVHADALLAGAARQLQRDLKRARVPEAKTRRFTAWLAGLEARLAIGVAGDYLLVSVGKDTALLERWGSDDCLARSPAFAPLRASYKPGLLGLSYSSASLAEISSFTPDDLRDLATNLTAAIPGGPGTAGLKERILKDVEALIKDIEADLLKPSATVSCSFLNKGIETLTFGGPPGRSLDYSQPLTILAHRGKQPILFAASRAAKNPGAYEEAVKWLNVLFGYFEDYAVPSFDPETRKQYDKVMTLARPFLASVDDTTRTCLVPTIEGAQYLFALDGAGELAAIPGARRQPPKPIPLPRLAFAMELADPAKFTEAIKRYADATRKLIAAASEAYPKQIPPGLTLPPPVVTDAAGGKLYSYAWPWKLGDDVYPCALLKGRLLVLATSASLAKEMADELPMPTSPVTALDKAAGSVGGADCRRAWDLLRRGTDTFFAFVRAESDANTPSGRADLQQAMLVKMHLDALWRSLGAFRGYSSTTTLRDGRLVTHSWLHVEDIAE